jgi:hypothetical protein
MSLVRAPSSSNPSVPLEPDALHEDDGNNPQPTPAEI